MADLRASGLGGVPKGATADRPSSPSIGDVFYNGTLGCLEIYTSSGWVANSAPTSIPTNVVATNQPSGRGFNNGQASVAFDAGSGGGLVLEYIVTPSPATSPATFTGSSSPISVTNLQSSQQYTYTVQSKNNFGISVASAASAAVTATTVPQAPTINSVSRGNAEATVTFTAGATGGSAITSYTVTSSPGNITASGASSPITVTGLTNGTAYTFTVTATNANGTSAASAASNSVTPVASLSVDYLVVAGGGSSGEGYEAGPGGAGGLRSTVTATGGGGSLEPALSCVPGTSYTVTVGAGAPKPGSPFNTFGIKGSNSVFATVTSQGGGGGGVYDSFSTAMNGGSGGGTSRNGTPGSGTANQGYNGANPGGGMESGGGGGAGAAGSSNGNGGIGVAVAITGSSTYYAGGGAGSGASGVGGLGGGGNQSSNGAANTGGGAGGTRMLNGGANGGSGVVILRWVTADTSINVGAGLTADATGTDGIYSYKRITAGTGTVTFS